MLQLYNNKDTEVRKLEYVLMSSRVVCAMRLLFFIVEVRKY